MITDVVEVADDDAIQTARMLAKSRDFLLEPLQGQMYGQLCRWQKSMGKIRL